MTTREKITRAILSMLQTIKKVNGYRTDIGNSVSLWGTQVIEHSDVYDLNLKDEGENINRGYSRAIKYKIEIAYSGANNYAVICDMLYDVERCLFINKNNIDVVVGSVGVRLLVGDNEMEIIREKDKERAYSVLSFSVEYAYGEKWVVN